MLFILAAVLAAQEGLDRPAIRAVDESIHGARAYRQGGYRLTDLQGDVYLLAYTKDIPRVIAQRLSHDDAPHPYEHLNPIVEPCGPEEKSIEGRRNPIRTEAAVRMFTQVIAEEAARGITPRYGKPHRWSKEFARRWSSRPENVAYTRFSKLLTALGSGVTHRFLVTGREPRLIDFITGRAEKSVTLDALFREAYRLCGGDVYLALLTMENVLSEYCRTEKRQCRAVTRRLARITNHEEDKGDKFGAWYHLTGLLLYAYVTDEQTALAVARTETLGSRYLSEGVDEAQEDFINEQGAILGARLKEIVLYRKHLAFDRKGVDYTDPKVYLDLTEKLK